LNTSSESVLITGGAGFIGSHLASALLRRGSKVAILDDLNDFYDPELKRLNLAEIGRAGSFEFILADIRDRTAVRDLGASWLGPSNRRLPHRGTALRGAVASRKSRLSSLHFGPGTALTA
jgi:NAD(P)-dependent dehydrogenase (short-subunit alcohol dehydrogenase family)